MWFMSTFDLWVSDVSFTAKLAIRAKSAGDLWDWHFCLLFPLLDISIWRRDFFVIHFIQASFHSSKQKAKPHSLSLTLFSQLQTYLCMKDRWNHMNRKKKLDLTFGLFFSFCCTFFPSPCKWQSQVDWPRFEPLLLRDATSEAKWEASDLTVEKNQATCSTTQWSQ